MTSAYAWRSHLGQRLAELHNLLRDLRACQGILARLLDAEFGTAEHLLLAAAVHYRRAFSSNRGLSAAELGKLGAVDLVLHRQIFEAADRAVNHSKDPFDETEVGVLTHGDQVQGVSLVSARRSLCEQKYLEDWSALISKIETGIILPMLEPAERAILDEARIMGIQLVRASPIVANDERARPASAFLRR